MIIKVKVSRNYDTDDYNWPEVTAEDRIEKAKLVFALAMAAGDLSDCIDAEII